MLRIYTGFHCFSLLLLLIYIVFPPPPHFYCFSLLLLLLLLISIVFPPPPPPPHSIVFCPSPTRFIFFSPRDSIKDCQLPSLVHFEAMSRVVNNNRGFLQLLADCPAYQRQFLLKTATPQQLHALVQVLYNVLMGRIPIPEENKRILLPYKDALLDLASPNVPYKKRKRVLVQEGSGFIEDVLASVVSSLGSLMLY